VTDPFAAIPPFTEAETVLPDLYEIVGRRQVGEDRTKPDFRSRVLA
jgi:hypothetical protein